MRKALRVGLLLLSFIFLSVETSHAQQTLGAINGTVTDSSGAAVQGSKVTARNTGTNLQVSGTSNAEGSFSFVDLPLGIYAVTFSKDGFQTKVYSQILVQGDRTATVNASLKPGEVSSSVTVEGTPLLNETDTTNGYTLGTELIENIPLGTGSFTQLALLSPGVNADFLSGSGSNAGLGNQNIFANGQRDSSNSFSVDGVLANNVFNGKSSSSVSDNRFVLNTGERFATNGGDILTATSVYDAIGQALPTPPPETIQEIQVNTSMYDSSEGSYSGAHVSLQTRTGANDFHGQAYEYHQTSAWNAASFFRNQDPTLRSNGQEVAPLKRNTFGATIGGPILKDKLFFFASYQGQRATDQDSSISEADVPPDLTNDRSAAALATVANQDFGTNLTANDISQVALKMMNQKLPNGQFLIPTPTVTNQSQALALGYDALLIGPPTRFSADQVNGNIDYNFSAKDRLSGKYYFQHDPSVAPFAVSQVEGFAQTLTAGSQVFSLENTTTVSPNAVWTQHFGFIREIAYANTQQGFTNNDFGISEFGLSNLPGINIGLTDNNVGNGLSIGPSSNFANAGIFQNQLEWSTNYSWIVGRHSLAFGFQYDRNQLNVINKNNETALLGFNDFTTFLTGTLCSATNSCSGADNSVFLNGESNRYFRTNQIGTFVQDNFRFRQNLTVNLGLRWDWDGPLNEKNGLLTNFFPQDYQFDASTDTIINSGIVVAGNNKTLGTKGVSASTITGRQWGFAPRIGVAWTPHFLKNFVVRSGFGLYYDRGEYFTELSPSAGQGISGPFGITVEQPFVVPFGSPANATFAAPFGTGAPPPPPTSLAGVQSLIPNIAQLEGRTTPFCIANGESFCGPLQFAGYDPANTLPYSENWTLNLQWQPVNNVVLSMAYVGNHGVHETIPIPFNQPGIATPSNPINGQIFSYGYNVKGVSAENVKTLVAGFTTGNAAVRVPFIGFDPNSQFTKTIGESNYNALQFNVTKRVSHGLTLSGSYTWSHSLDEESGAQLFYNGNNPLLPHTGYGNSDFDRRHVFIVSYEYDLPKARNVHGWLAQAVNGWGTNGLVVAESGQPFSVIDFSGGAGSLFFGGGQDEVTNPLVPVGGLGSKSNQAVLQGTTGINPGSPILNPAAFGVPILAPGQSGVPPCDPVTGVCDFFETGFGTGTRNAFHGPFQSRFDAALFKDIQLTERFKLRFNFQAFNIFNHPSFDTPNNEVRFNPSFKDPPIYAPTGGGPDLSCGGPTLGFAYRCPPTGSLGLIQHTIGSPRFLQMSLHLIF